MYVILEDGQVMTTKVNPTIFPVSIESPDDIVYGDHYINGEWIRDGYRPPAPTPEQVRKRYESEAVLLIRQIYSADDENKIIRQYLSSMNNVDYKLQFEEYNAYVEQCKDEAHKEVYSTQ